MAIYFPLSFPPKMATAGAVGREENICCSAKSNISNSREQPATTKKCIKLHSSRLKLVYHVPWLSWLLITKTSDPFFCCLLFRCFRPFPVCKDQAKMSKGIWSIFVGSFFIPLLRLQRVFFFHVLLLYPI